MIGGFSESEVSQEHIDLVQSNTQNISSTLGVNAASFTVNSAWVQVVAGTNYFFHLTADNGDKFSVVIFVPLPHTNAPAEVSLAEVGHTQARNPHS